MDTIYVVVVEERDKFSVPELIYSKEAVWFTDKEDAEIYYEEMRDVYVGRMWDDADNPEYDTYITLNWFEAKKGPNVREEV